MTLAVPLLTKAEAKRLTRRIKTTGEALWALLAEAHEGKAYSALGYATWKSYCEAEFDMGERTAFRVLDQGKVAKALSAAANEPVEISQRQAAAVKPHLNEAVERITQGEAPAQVVESLAKVPQAEPSETEVVDAVATAGQSGPGERTPPAIAQDPAPREAGEEVVAAVPLAATSDPVAGLKPLECFRCGRQISQVAQAIGLGLRPADRSYSVVDKTWRHTEDGSVAILPDGNVVCEAPAKSGGEGPARAKGAALSAGPTEALSPTELAKALVKLTAKDWESISTGLVGQLSSACRRRLGSADTPEPTMRARPTPAKPAKPKAKKADAKAKAEVEDCRHPSNRRIGEKRDFCGACNLRVA